MRGELMKELFSNVGQLVSFRTVDDFEIVGMLFQNDPNSLRKIVVHIHGNFGNFYQNKFLWYMSKIYCQSGIDLLTVNLSSHDGLAEGYYGVQLKYVGGGVADYNDSQKDIQAAVDFAKRRGYEEIILQGHSLGCDKIIEYSVSTHGDNKMILLSPVDSYAVQTLWRKPETVEEQITRIEAMEFSERDNGWGKADLNWANKNEYGALGDCAEWVYQIPITYDALIKILKGSAFHYLNLEKNPEYSLSNKCIAFVGKKDGLQLHRQSVWIDYLRSKFTNLMVIDDLDADHDVVGVEEILINRIVRWIEA